MYKELLLEVSLTLQLMIKEKYIIGVVGNMELQEMLELKIVMYQNLSNISNICNKNKR
jgi:hypothetical protein